MSKVLAPHSTFAQKSRMLARTPLTKIEVEDIGTVRHLNCWQIARIKHVRGPNRAIARLAFACGMSIKQFKHLPVNKQEQIRRAVLVITSPVNV
jgi:hypothetical protein